MLTLHKGTQKTVVFADGDRRFRTPSALVFSEAAYHVISASSAEEAVEKVRNFAGPIHLLLANVELPEMGGAQLIQRLHPFWPEMKSVLFSANASGWRLLQHHCHLPAPITPEMLSAIVREFLGGERQTAISDGARSLTKREVEVLKLIAEGRSTKEISSLLHIAFKTAVGHRTHLMQKLEVHDAVSVARYAIRAGIAEA